jgi:hypothetical protein
MFAWRCFKATVILKHQRKLSMEKKRKKACARFGQNLLGDGQGPENALTRRESEVRSSSLEGRHLLFFSCLLTPDF